MNERFSNAVGMKVAEELCAALNPACERLAVAGSLRRCKPTVGDVEIVYISKTEVRQSPGDMFASITVNLADEAIASLEKSGVLERRKNANGSEMYGPKNKLMRHLASGMPVDFFAATTENWWNYLVCRTGPADSNKRICMAAQERGWKWNPYGAGFSRDGETRAMKSEAEVFAFVGLPYVPAAKYVQVRCKACGWEDGLREDIVAKGELSMYCDSCSDVRPVEIIATGGPGRAQPGSLHPAGSAD